MAHTGDFETRDAERSSAAEMHLNRLLNEANARGVRTRDALLALADELGVAATDYDEDGAQLHLDDDSDPVVRFDGTRWVQAGI